MRAGLEASTVTPGNTAPEASRAVPTIDACANASEGTKARPITTRIPLNNRCMQLLRRAVIPESQRFMEIPIWLGLILLRYERSVRDDLTEQRFTAAGGAVGKRDQPQNEGQGQHRRRR